MMEDEEAPRVYIVTFLSPKGHEEPFWIDAHSPNAAIRAAMTFTAFSPRDLVRVETFGVPAGPPNRDGGQAGGPVEPAAAPAGKGSPREQSAISHYQHSRLACSACNARGAVTWEDVIEDQLLRRQFVRMSGDFHMETGRMTPDRRVIVCSLCDEIYGVLPSAGFSLPKGH